MATQVIAVDPQHPEPETILRAASVLRAGGLVAFPTETVYGLGANALSALAVQRIFAAKGRPAHNPIIVHVADTQQARQLTRAWPEIAERLAQRFWPGPLTLVLPRAALVPDVVTAGGPTVALRVPAHPVALALIRAAQLPLAAPSANRSTQLSPTQARHVWRSLAGEVEIILDGGSTTGGLESTVLDVTTSPPRLLRPGLIAPTELEGITGPITRTLSGASATQALPSPGMMERHYAPHTPLICVADGEEMVRDLLERDVRVGWLTFRAGSDDPTTLCRLVMPGDASGYASVLYASLHTLEEMGVEQLVLDLPPTSEDWLAIHDRLRRMTG